MWAGEFITALWAIGLLSAIACIVVADIFKGDFDAW